MWPAARPPSREQIRESFGLDVDELAPHEGGFEADAFTDGRWFLKLFRFRPDSDDALAMTVELAARGLPVPAPVRALDGSYTAEHDGRRYALFPFVDGREATWDDADAIAYAMRAMHDIVDLELAQVPIDESPLFKYDGFRSIEVLRDRHDHPWLAGYRDEIQAGVDRLEAVIERARAIEVPNVVCHHDLFPHNIIVDRDGRIAALLDWSHTWLAPREHDLFLALYGPEPVRFLRAYGAEGLDLTHLEYARLASSLRHIAVRVRKEVEREWIGDGIDGLRRLDAHLGLARPFCG